MSYDPEKALLAAQYLRVAALAIYTFDYLQTIPAELRLYRKARAEHRLKLAANLFAAVRYLGFLALIVNCVGYFGQSVPGICTMYRSFAPISRILSAVANQLVFFWRTWAISGKKTWVFWVLVGTMVGSLATEVTGSALFISRVVHERCGVFIEIDRRVTTTFYIGAMLYDILVGGLSTVFLMRTGAGFGMNSSFTFTKALIGDGLLYVLAATIINLGNLIMTLLPFTALQSSLSEPAIAFTAMASGRLILNLQEKFRNGSSHEDTMGDSNSRPIRTIGGGMTTRGRKNDDMEMKPTDTLPVRIHIAVEHDQRLDTKGDYDVERDSNRSSRGDLTKYP